jgi:Phosphate-induced protein 1 conserved region
MTSAWRALGLIIATGVCVVSLPMLAPAGGDDDTKPNGRRAGTLLNPGNGNVGETKSARPGGGGTTSNGINYHGGPVMLGTVNVYYIWYGNWSGNDAVTILTDFAQNIGGSNYYNINTTYYDGSNTHLSNSVHYVTSTTDGYSHGTALSDSAIQDIVVQNINKFQGLPLDANGVYFVLTSADVTATSGFCTTYCGWHTYGTISGSNIKYAFVGDPTRCPTACEVQTTGPNGSTGADGMASVIAHELEEAATDPQLNAWYDRRGYENADKCAWTFGATYTAANGALANMTLGSRNFLIQRNWVNASGGYCALSY